MQMDQTVDKTIATIRRSCTDQLSLCIAAGFKRIWVGSPPADLLTLIDANQSVCILRIAVLYVAVFIGQLIDRRDALPAQMAAESSARCFRLHVLRTFVFCEAKLEI